MESDTNHHVAMILAERGDAMRLTGGTGIWPRVPAKTNHERVIRRDVARVWYRKAALLEERALADSSRDPLGLSWPGLPIQEYIQSRGVLAVSAVSLWRDAGDIRRCARLARVLDWDSGLSGWAIHKIARISQDTRERWDRMMRQQDERRAARRRRQKGQKRG